MQTRVRIEGKVKFRGLPLLPYAELKPPVKIFYFLVKLFLRFVGHRKTKVEVQLVRFIYHKTRGSKEPAKTKIVGPNLEI